MLGSNPGQLRLRHWLSDALTTRLHLIHYSLFISKEVPWYISDNVGIIVGSKHFFFYSTQTKVKSPRMYGTDILENCFNSWQNSCWLVYKNRRILFLFHTPHKKLVAKMFTNSKTAEKNVALLHCYVDIMIKGNFSR